MQALDIKTVKLGIKSVNPFLLLPIVKSLKSDFGGYYIRENKCGK
jgi:hypothetical protein